MCDIPHPPPTSQPPHPQPLDFSGEVKHWSGLGNVHIGTIRTILRLIWGIGLVLSPPTFSYGEIGSWWLPIKLTHSRIRKWYVTGCKHFWDPMHETRYSSFTSEAISGVIMNGLWSYLFVYRGLQPEVFLTGSSAALMWRLRTEFAQKSPFWYCGCSSVSLGLNWRRSYI